MTNHIGKEPVPFGPSKEVEGLLGSRKKEPRNHIFRIFIAFAILIVLSIVAVAGTRTTINGDFRTTPDEVVLNKTSIISSTTVPETVHNATTPSTYATTTTSSTTEASVPTTTKATLNAVNNVTEIMTKRAVKYQISWGAYHACVFPMCIFPASLPSGCALGRGPSIRLWCGQGGTLKFIPPSNCQLYDQGIRPTLNCHGTMNRSDTVRVTCEGVRNQELLVEVQVDGQSYLCDQILNEYHSWNGVIYERGGAVGQQLSVSTFKNNTWTEVLSERRTGYCSTGRECSDGYLSCQGSASCGAIVPYLLTSVTEKDALSAAIVLG